MIRKRCERQLACSSMAQSSEPPQVQVKEEGTHWVIEAAGRAAASPDLTHLMMKMEFRPRRLRLT